MIWGSGGSKSRLAKAAGAEPAGQMRDEKLHAVVARSTFASQNVQNTWVSEHFWKLRCRKSARRCGAKHISKSKGAKHTMYGPFLEVPMSKKCTPLWREAHFVGPLLEVAMSKKCTPLWREAHFQVKRCKTHHVRTIFGGSDVEKVHAVVARSTFPSQMYKTHHVRTIFGGSDVVSRGRRKGLWTLSKVSQTWGFCGILNYNHHYTTLHSNTLHYTTTTTTPWLHSTTLQSTTLDCTQLHSITLNYITLHYITLHYTPLHYITLHYTTLHYATLPSTTLHYTTLHSTTTTTTQNYTTLHYTTLHSTTLHYTTLHYTTLHYTEWHCTTDRQVDR